MFHAPLTHLYCVSPQGEIGTETRYSTDLTAQILYVIYAFLVVILLSNVLIAIVTDSYEIIQNDRAAIVFWSNRSIFAEWTPLSRYQRVSVCRRNLRHGTGS
jgi:ABC-type phosphate transport system permease subunit